MAKKLTLKTAKKVGDRLGVDWSKVNLRQFRKGLKVELEHSDITHGAYSLTGKIALAHLEELPDYYTRLAKMEKG